MVGSFFGWRLVNRTAFYAHWSEFRSSSGLFANPWRPFRSEIFDGRKPHPITRTNRYSDDGIKPLFQNGASTP